VTADQVPVDDPEVLRRILANTEALLLDFDGPICSIFAGFPAHLVAHQLRGVLSDGGHANIPPEVEKTDDPFDVFNYAATLGENEARYVEAALRAHEVEAAVTAEPTPGAHDLLRAWYATGRRLAIVSNNSVAAVTTYLNLHDLTALVTCVSARTEANPDLLKPASHLVDQAMALLAIRSKRCTLIGDSSSDIEAAERAGVMSIGYANKTLKIGRLQRATPQVVITDLLTIVNSIS
jgi:HAD superfamily hydrolase (TIGR01549 family)